MVVLLLLMCKRVADTGYTFVAYSIAVSRLRSNLIPRLTTVALSLLSVKSLPMKVLALS
jgi:hypothetical protein